jgi:hypothetical protein
VGYVVAGRNSHGVATDEFLDLFRGKGRAILVSAQMLLEGFDDMTRRQMRPGTCVRINDRDRSLLHAALVLIDAYKNIKEEEITAAPGVKKYRTFVPVTQ